MLNFHRCLVYLANDLICAPTTTMMMMMKQVRLTLKYIQDNQFPAVTVFRDNRPRYYQRDDMTGAWTLARF